MTRDQLLEQLRDIRPPLEPVWWLPAPGHLVTGLALLVLLTVVVIWLLRRRTNRRLLLARRELRRIAAEHAGDDDAMRLARALAPWLKRVALQAFPEQRIEAATGSKWLEFLDRGIGGERFSRGPGQVFGADIYRPGTPAGVDADALLQLCDNWLAGIAPRLRGTGG